MLTAIYNQTSFQAKFVSKDKIQILDKNDNSYHPAEISILEIEPNKKEDVSVLKDRANIWKDKNSFAKNIACFVEEIYEKKTPAKGEIFYIATLQDKDFEELNPQKVLGMAEITKFKRNGAIMLQCLLVDPKLADKTKNPEIKGVGRSIIRVLKKQKDVKTIILTSLRSAQGFYEKLGFEFFDAEKLSYIWKKVKPKHKTSVLNRFM